MSAVIYYIIVYPLSFLPIRVLYVLSDFFYLLLISIVPYRRKVIRENIARSFPNLSSNERKSIERKFYRHLADLLAESTKELSLSEKKLKRRFTIKNPEVMEQLYTDRKNVLLVSGHYNNWEWLIAGQNLFFQHQAVGIGMPLTNGFWNKKLNERRARFGMDIIHSKTVYDYFDTSDKTIATLVLADQSPGDSKKCYWTTFLNQQSGFVFGPELLANKYNHAVVYFYLEKTKRGHYTMHLEEITSSPRSTEYGFITERYKTLLEETIQRQPEFWIWSHKRWKREVPSNLEELKQQQKTSFLKKFR